MSVELGMTVIVEALHSGFLDRSVHPFDLAVCPRMFPLRQPVLDAVFPAALPSRLKKIMHHQNMGSNTSMKSVIEGSIAAVCINMRMVQQDGCEVPDWKKLF